MAGVRAERLEGHIEPPEGDIFGRDEIIEALRLSFETASAAGHRLVISGVPGVGKSTVAAAIASSIAPNYDLVTSVSCEERVGGSGPESIAQRLLAKLTGIDSPGPNAIEVLQATLSRTNALLVLTDVSNANQLLGLGLPSQCDLIVTSPSRLSLLDGFESLVLGPIPMAASMDLLRHYSDADGPFEDLAVSCLHHPGLLRICAAAIRAGGFASAESLASVLGNPAQIANQLGLGESVTSALEKVTLSLSPASRKLLSRLGSVAFGSVLVDDMIAVLCDGTVSVLDLASLREWHMIDTIVKDGAQFVVVSRFVRETMPSLFSGKKSSLSWSLLIAERVVSRAEDAIDKLSLRAVRDRLADDGIGPVLSQIGNSEADLYREWSNTLSAFLLLTSYSGDRTREDSQARRLHTTLRAIGFWQHRSGQARQLLSTAFLLQQCSHGDGWGLYKHTANAFIGAALGSLGLPERSVQYLAASFDQMNDDFTLLRELYGANEKHLPQDAQEIALFVSLIEWTLVELGQNVAELTSIELTSVIDSSWIIGRSVPNEGTSDPELMAQVNITRHVLEGNGSPHSKAVARSMLAESWANAIVGRDVNDTIIEGFETVVASALKDTRDVGDIYATLRVVAAKERVGSPDPAAMSLTLAAVMNFGSTSLAAETAYVAGLAALVSQGIEEDQIEVFDHYLQVGGLTPEVTWQSGAELMTAVFEKSVWILARVGNYRGLRRTQDYARRLSRTTDPRFEKFVHQIEEVIVTLATPQHERLTSLVPRIPIAENTQFLPLPESSVEE